jgi:hypothetical protein
MKINKTYDVQEYCVRNGEPQCAQCDCTDETCTEWQCIVFGELGELDQYGNLLPCQECLSARLDEKLKQHTMPDGYSFEVGV